MFNGRELKQEKNKTIHYKILFLCVFVTCACFKIRDKKIPNLIKICLF